MRPDTDFACFLGLRFNQHTPGIMLVRRVISKREFFHERSGSDATDVVARRRCLRGRPALEAQRRMPHQGQRLPPASLQLANAAHAPRLPLVLQSVADVELLRIHARAVRRLPRAGPKVAIPGLEAPRAQQLERRIRAYIQACGCAEGATMALIGMLSVLGWVVYGVALRGPRWGDLATAAAGLLLAVLGGGLGKLLGLAIARLRFERSCVRAIRTLQQQAMKLRRQGSTT